LQPKDIEKTVFCQQFESRRFDMNGLRGWLAIATLATELMLKYIRIVIRGHIF